MGERMEIITKRQFEELMAGIDAKDKRIKELEAQNKELLDKPCSTCGQDERIAQIGKRLGFRPDVGALEISRLQARLDAVAAVGFNTHVSWNCDKDFNDGWNACREQVEAALQQEKTDE